MLSIWWRTFGSSCRRVDIVDINKAKREGTLGELLEGNEETAAELERAANAGTKVEASDRVVETAAGSESASTTNGTETAPKPKPKPRAKPRNSAKP